MNNLIPLVSKKLANVGGDEKKVQKIMRKEMNKLLDEKLSAMDKPDEVYSEQPEPMRSGRAMPNVMMNTSVSSRTRKNKPNTGLFGRKMDGSTVNEDTDSHMLGEDSDSVQDPVDPPDFEKPVLIGHQKMTSEFIFDRKLPDAINSYNTSSEGKRALSGDRQMQHALKLSKATRSQKQVGFGGLKSPYR